MSTRRRALLIGVSRYRHPQLADLDSPLRDLEGLASVLGDPALGDFPDIQTVPNPLAADAGKALYDFLAAAEPDHFLFVYYSGHGAKTPDGRLYLTAVDSEPRRLPPTAVSTDELRHYVDACDARELVVVLDCCYAGAFGELKQRSDRSRVVLVSAGALERAHEGEGHEDYARPSAFTGPFVEGLRTGAADTDDNGLITVREAFDHTVRRMRSTRPQQQPQIRAAGTGDLVLAPAPARPEALDRDVTALLRNGMPAARELAVGQLSALLQGEDRVLARAAERELEKLTHDRDDRVAMRASQALARTAAATPVTAVSSGAEAPPDPGWFRTAVCYEVRVRSFFDADGDGQGDLRGLGQKLEYLQDLGVDALILTPIYDSPMRSDGMDVRDFRAVQSDLGTIEHLVELLTLAHRRGIRIILDLVLNHTSDEHPWFLASRQDPTGPYGGYYVWSASGEDYPDAEAPLTGPGPGWAFDATRRAYYLHRFSPHEPDLNYDDPEVRAAMRDVMDFWLRLGVDGFRLLTAPYLFERRETSSKDLDETHAYLRGLRHWLEEAYPDRVLIAWSDSWPRDATPYFGDQASAGCQVVMYSSLMPSVLLAILHEQHSPISDVLAEMRPPEHDARWALFLRNGDEMPLGLLGSQHRDELLHEYAPLSRMRGPTGIRRRMAPMLSDDRGQSQLAFALFLSMPGVPILYYGEEIGMGENLSLPGTQSVKTPMQWAPDRNGGFTESEPENLPIPAIQHSVYGYLARNVESQRRTPSSLLRLLKTLIDARKGVPALSDSGSALLRSTNPAILAYLRGDGPEKVVCLVNFARYPQSTRVDLSEFAGAVPTEVIGGAPFPVVPDIGDYRVDVAGHGFLWFRVTSPAPPEG